MKRRLHKSERAKNEEIMNDGNEEYTKLNFGVLSAVFFIVISSIFPLYITRMGYGFITKEKADFFIFITILTTLGVIIALLTTMDTKRPINYIVQNLLNKRPIAISELALVAFLLLTLASAIASPWNDFVWNGFTHNGIHGRWEGFWAFLAYGLAFFIIARFYQPQRLHFIIFACSAILLTLHAIMQYMSFDILERTGFILLEQHQPPLTRMFRTTLGNINVVSAYSSLTIILFAVLFAGENSKWSAFYLVASALSFAMLMITRGYAGQVGVLGAMVLLIPYWLSDRRRLGKILIAISSWCAVHAINQLYLSFLQNRPEIDQPADAADRAFLNAFTPSHPALFIVLAIVLLAAGLGLIFALKKLKWPERPLRIAGLATLGAAVVGGLLFVQIAGARWENQPGNIVWQAREILHGRMGDHFGSARGWVWRNGLSVIRYNPWLGTGPDTFFFALGGVQTTSLVEALVHPQVIIGLGGLHRDSMESVGMWFDKAHNTFLQIAVCKGVPALFVFLIFLGALFIPAIKKAFNQPVLLAFGAAALSFFIQSFFQIDTPIDRPLIYIVLGVMAVELSRTKDQSVKDCGVDVSDVKETV